MWMDGWRKRSPDFVHGEWCEGRQPLLKGRQDRLHSTQDRTDRLHSTQGRPDRPHSTQGRQTPQYTGQTDSTVRRAGQTDPTVRTPFNSVWVSGRVRAW